MANFSGIIEKIHIAKFRKFQNLTIRCGRKLTVIAGQNGTQKTTLLGLLAHPFSMSKKNPDDDEKIVFEDTSAVSFSEFKTIQGRLFQSKFANKFKFDETKEKSKDHEYSLYMVDKTIGDQGVFTLESMLRDKKSKKLRLWKKGARAAGDGYMHFPVIYLSLKRVSPIGEEKRIKKQEIDLTEDEQKFLKTNYEEILCLPEETYETDKLKSSNKDTLVSHPDSYSALTVSAGQDNIGSILTAVLSFKRLKEKFPQEYEGGLLFIDEIESTLYPAAQEQLVKKLFKFARDFQLQIFCTTHSPSVIDVAMNPVYKRECVFSYLKLATASTVIVDGNATPEQIYAHLSLRTIRKERQEHSKLRVYTEDEEARLFLKALLPRKYLKLLDIVKVNIGANELIDLKRRNIREFTANFIILDGDQSVSGRNIIELPGTVGPDHLLYDFLKEIPMEDSFWQDPPKTGGYSQQICFKNFKELSSCREGEKRQFYKNWFREQCENQYWGKNNLSAFTCWCKRHPDDANAFLEKFVKTYNYLAKKNEMPLI